MNVNKHNEKKNGYVIVDLSGELDLYTSGDFKKEIQDIIAGGETKIVFHVPGMTYIDSSGVGALISILQNLKKNGGILKLVGVQDSPLKVFELANLNRILNVYSSLEDAIKE